MKSKTRYYFKVTATDSNNNATSSDIYVIDTAQDSVIPQILTDMMVFTSEDVYLSNSVTAGKQLVLVLPLNTSFSFKFNVTEKEIVKNVKVILRNAQVLGVTTNS